MERFDVSNAYNIICLLGWVNLSVVGGAALKPFQPYKWIPQMVKNFSSGQGQRHMSFIESFVTLHDHSVDLHVAMSGQAWDHGHCLC